MSHGCSNLFDLHVRQGDHRERAFVTVNKLEMKFQDEGVTRTFFIEPGFEYDLASVPKIFHSLIGPNELCWVAAAIHDVLYRHRGNLTSTPEAEVIPYRTYSRKESDQFFLQLMTRGDVKRWKRVLAYWAVRSPLGYWNWIK